MTEHKCFPPPRPTYRAVYHCPVCNDWFATEYSSCADIFYWEPCSELHARLFHHKEWDAISHHEFRQHLSKEHRS